MDCLVFNQSFFMAKSINNRILLQEFSLATFHCSLELNMLDALECLLMNGTKRTQYKLMKTSENTTGQTNRSMISSPIWNKNKGRGEFTNILVHQNGFVRRNFPRVFWCDDDYGSKLQPQKRLTANVPKVWQSLWQTQILMWLKVTFCWPVMTS